MLQGAAVGGEIPGSFVFVAEHVPNPCVGAAWGILQAGLCCGNIPGSGAALLISKLFTSAEILEFAWRIPFFAGAIFGLVASYPQMVARDACFR